MIERVRELVDDDVVAVAHVGGAAEHVVPREHEDPAGRGLAEPRGVALDDDTIPRVGERSLVRARVDEDHVELRVRLDVATEQQQAGLRGDGDSDLVGELEPSAALERLLGEEDVNQSLELFALLGGEHFHVGHVALEQLAPLLGERLLAQLVALLLVEVVEDHQTSNARNLSGCATFFTAAERSSPNLNL